MIDIYLDCADLNAMREAVKNPLVKGFTTNPSLIRAAGVTNYEDFCIEAMSIVDGLPISFEIIADDFKEMEFQARKISSLGGNAYVKIPISNTNGESSIPLIRTLSGDGIPCNITAVFTNKQIRECFEGVQGNRGIISVFAGRISDTGKNPEKRANFIRDFDIRMLWASTREVFNIYQAKRNRWDIITVSPELLKKYEQLEGKDLTEYSLDTVKQFYNDAQKAGYTL